MEESAQVPDYQELLINRHDLSTELAKKLYWGVSAALRKHIIANFDLDPTSLDTTMEEAVNDALAGDTKTVRKQSAPQETRQHICEQDLHDLVALLRKGDVARFLDKFTGLSKLRLTLVRRLLFEPGGDGLAIACKGIGLD